MTAWMPTVPRSALQESRTGFDLPQPERSEAAHRPTPLGSRLCGNDGGVTGSPPAWKPRHAFALRVIEGHWIPACAGTTVQATRGKREYP